MKKMAIKRKFHTLQPPVVIYELNRKTIVDAHAMSFYDREYQRGQDDCQAGIKFSEQTEGYFDGYHEREQLEGRND